MVEPNESVRCRQCNTAETAVGKLPAVAVREMTKPRYRGWFVRAGVILAMTGLLLVAGCQPKHDANVAAGQNKPAVAAEDSASQRKQVANAAADENKPAANLDNSAQVEKTPKTVDSTANGIRVYASCARCHQPNGQGIVGEYPPLDGNPLVNGRADIVARIVLRGLHGPVEVNGKTFDGTMPSWSRFDDSSLAAVLTYVRGNGSNHAPPVSQELVAAVRKATSERTEAWTMPELESTPLIEVAK